jgi:hypothetical protein
MYRRRHIRAGPNPWPPRTDSDVMDVSSIESPPALSAVRLTWCPAVAWALLGIAFVATGASVIARWLASGTATFSWGDYGGLNGFYRAEVRAVQSLALLLIIAIVAVLIHESRKAGRLTFPAAVCLGYLSAVWMDPLGNLHLSGVKYNVAWLNTTTWGPYIPGWNSPGSAHEIEPIFVSWFGYLLGMVWFLATAWITQLLILRRWPRLRGVPLVLAVLATSALVDAVLQLFCVLTGWYSFPRTIQAVTLLAGHQYQLPMLNTIAEGILWAGIPYLVYRRYRSGGPESTFVLRGLTRLPRRLQPAVETIAIIGFINLCLLLFFLSYYLLAKSGTIVPVRGPYHMV